MKYIMKLALLSLCAQAAPLAPSATQASAESVSSSKTPQISQGATNTICDTQEHVVILSNDSPHPDEVMARLGLSSNHTNVTHTFNNPAFKGFSAMIHRHSVSALNDMSDVVHVEQTTQVKPRSYERLDAPWGLQRISSAGSVRGDPTKASFQYAYDNDQLGGGVDMYIVDSGIYGENEEFGERVYQGFSVNASDTTDGDGHGTHVSGTAAGAHFGVASNANLVAIKVLDSTGSGSSSGTIAGMDKVVNFHDYRKTQPNFIGSVMSMSWGLAGTSSAVNAAVVAASEYGIHVSVAAGNDGGDACDYSPSQVGGKKSDSIISVGSIGQSDEISYFSNTGNCVDVYAPGENVLSAWIGSVDNTNVLSGTSMATPHVSGLMAYLMASDKSLATSTIALKAKVLSMAQQGLTESMINGQSNILMLNNDVSI